MNRIPVVMSIDVEPEDRLIATDTRPDWPGFERSHEFFNELRPRFQEATGAPVHYSWFFRMDPQIAHVYGTADWVARRYGPLVEQLRSSGDALGLHVHPWRLDSASNEWYSEFANQEWVDHCVRTAFQAFEASFGEPCVYFRFGDHWMNNATVALIERIGARFDLTLEPGQTGPHLQDRFTGSFPDCSEVPRHPYRPSKSAFTRPGSLFKRRLWMVPLSAGLAGSAQQPANAAVNALSPSGPDVGPPEPQRHVTMNLFDDSSTLCLIADRLLARERKTHLVMVVRSDIVLNPLWDTNLRRTLDHILNHPLANRLVFANPDELVRRLK